MRLDRFSTKEQEALAAAQSLAQAHAHQQLLPEPVLLTLAIAVLAVVGVAAGRVSAAAAPMTGRGEPAPAAVAGKSDLQISAKVDKSQVDLGKPLTLTITLEGDLTHATVKPFEFPKTFQVLAQSQASNVSVGAGGVQRSMSLIYLLIAREPGTFQLGPFQVMRQDVPVQTESIQVTVTKPVLPPETETKQRFTL